ncbi:MAG: M6 family metalloprotease domain-containing protein, partial [Armatimonadota bacterium]|nr:M6 family metalloprotease domain-containing protein [Armatimonadota bacterium]
MRIKIILGDIMALAGRVLVLTLLTAATVQAAPFAKRIQFEQPNGERIELWGQGDEFYAVFETLDGYTVVFDSATKAYYYAKLSADGNDLLSTGLQVGQGDPTTLGLTPHLRANPQAVKERARERQSKWDKGTGVSSRWKALKSKRQIEDKARRNNAVLPAPPSSTTTGTKLGLCLLIDFSDDPATIAQSNIVDFCNGDNYTGYGNNGSVKKYFQDNSNGLLTYSNVVTVYIRMTNPKTTYNNTAIDAGVNARLLIQDAITIMKAMTNYTTEILPTFNNLTVDASSNVVACNVFYAGGNGGVWSMGLWPHSWALASPKELSSGGKKVYSYQITDIGSSLAIGTFCHENGHMLCDFPDIYDYTYTSYGGAGSFCLMGYGSYDNNPVQVNAYLKRAAGWATITELTSTSYLTASLTSSAGSEFNHFYRFQKPGVSTEYFLVENRQQAGRDALIAASGVAIWHVDELGDRDDSSIAINTTHANYELTLVQADNKWHFENNQNSGDANDLYYSGNSSAAYNNQFSDSSLPQAHWWDGTAFGMIFRNFSTSGTTMTFLVEGNIVAPQNVQASAGTYTDRVRVTWDAASGATNYSIYRNTSSSSSTASLLANTTALFYDDISVSPGVVYYYWIQATAPTASSGFSAMCYGSTKLTPPTALSASQGSSLDYVQLSWSASSGSPGYIIYRNSRNSSSAASEITRVSSPSCDDSTAIPGDLYYYWVKAYSIATTSAFSSVASGYRGLSAPSGISASGGTYSSGIQVSWSGVSGAISYLVWRSANADSS